MNRINEGKVMGITDRTRNRIAVGAATGLGALLLFGTSTPAAVAGHVGDPGLSSSTQSDYEGYEDYEDYEDYDDYEDSSSTGSFDSGSSTDGAVDDSTSSDGSESGTGGAGGGYIGSSDWVLDQSERDMWNSYNNRINSW